MTRGNDAIASALVASALRTSRRAAAALALGLPIVLVAPPGAAQTDAAPPGAEPLLTWDERHALLAPNAVPLVQVFDDGRVVVTRPEGFTDPGTYTFEVDPATLDRLETLARQALRDPETSLDADEARAPVGDLVLEETVLPDGSVVARGISDPTLTVFEYAPATAGATAFTPPPSPGGGAAVALPDDGTATLGGYLAAPGAAPTLDALQDVVQTLFSAAPERAR